MSGFGFGFGFGATSQWTLQGAAGGAGDTTAPVITSASSVSVAENETLAHALTANEAARWVIVGGADAERFELSGATLRWLGNGTKDFEAPDDAGANNSYVVQVGAIDAAGNSAAQTITVSVTDISEGGGEPAEADGAVFFGQSNMAGGGAAGVAPPSNFSDIGSAGKIWTGANPGTSFQPYQASVNSDIPAGTLAWGPEGEAMRQWLAANPGKAFYAIKYAVDGTSLGVSAGASDWHTSTNKLHKDTRDRITAAKAAVPGLKIAWAAKGQWERDAEDQAKTDAYAANLDLEVASIRSTWSDADTIITAQLPNDEQYGNAGDAADRAVRLLAIKQVFAAKAAADPKFRVLTTNDRTPGADKKHFVTAADMVAIGAKHYKAFLGTLDATPAAFTLNDLTNQATSTVVQSNQITVTGIETTVLATISGTGFEFRVLAKDGRVARDYSTAPYYVDLNQIVQVRVTAAASNGVEQSGTLTIGGVSDTWSVTTGSANFANTETQAYQDAVTALGGGSFGSGQMSALDTFYSDIKAAGLYTSLGHTSNILKRVYLYGNPAGEIAARLNLTDHTTQAIKTNPNGSLAWSATNGYSNPTINGGNYVQLNINPSTSLGQNGVAVGGYQKTYGATNGHLIGGNQTTGTRIHFGRRDNAGVPTIRMSIATAANVIKTTGTTAGPGFFAGVRHSSALIKTYKPDGTPGVTDGTASGALTDTLLATPGAASITNDQITFAFVADFTGAPDIDAKVQALRNAVVALVTSMGAN